MDIISNGAAIIKTSYAIMKVFFYIKRKLRRWPVRKIVIYGESGVGKSQFLNSLMGNTFVVESRTEDIKTYKWDFPDGHRIELIDVPGHRSLSNIRQRLEKEFSHGRIYGVINLVAHGYLISSDVNKANVFTVGPQKTVKTQYLSDNRNRELSQINEWIKNLRADNKVKWFMTVVNKADIWYSERNEVIESYKNGAYRDLVKQLELSCSKVVTYPYCSIISPFGGEPMMLSMSEHHKWEMHKTLIDEIFSLSFDD